jgi:hypothetical protein
MMMKDMWVERFAVLVTGKKNGIFITTAVVS